MRRGLESRTTLARVVVLLIIQKNTITVNGIAARWICLFYCFIYLFFFFVLVPVYSYCAIALV